MLLYLVWFTNLIAINCQPCNCNLNHTTGDCADETGICECLPQFTGSNCTTCAFGYHDPPECRRCDCYLEGTIGQVCAVPAGGSCPCKNNFGDNNCGRCAHGFWNFPECIPCTCNGLGIQDNTCEQDTAQCHCQFSFTGLQCDQCSNGYFGYPSCSFCDCDETGTVESVCDKETGQCFCEENFTGARCDRCATSFHFFPECRLNPQIRQSMNCESLSEDLQVLWMISGSEIMFELAGRIDRNTDYMAFGLSGDDSTFKMVDSDIVVVDYKAGRRPRAVDYYITDYAQCSTNGGVCPDTSSFLSSTNDITRGSGEVSQGVTRVSYTRALVTRDVANGGRDKAYKTDGTPQQVVWSIGPLNSNDQAAKHHAVGGRITASKTINFGRAIQNNCRIFEPKDKVVLPNFKPYHIYGGSGIVFTAEIGQSASAQGYQAITGQPSVGIAWYINGILAPELHLKRGESYTFRVAGGDNSTQGSKYHPFYFTDSVKGGYGVNSQGTIYPGSVNGQSMEKAVGGYCEWMLDLNAEEKVYNCFDEYKADLRLRCDDNPGRYTEFVFTPSAAMPDVIYYQCYMHVNLGWKINLLDEFPVDPIMNPSCIEPPTAPTTTPGPVTPGTPSGGTIPTSQEGETILPPSGKASETKATQPLTAAIQACCVVVHVFMWAKDAIPPAV